MIGEDKRVFKVSFENDHHGKINKNKMNTGLLKKKPQTSILFSESDCTAKENIYHR